MGSKVDKYLNYFVFFLAFPCLNILGNSVTFYLFISIVAKTGFGFFERFKGKNIFYWFLTAIIISTILAPSLERAPWIIAGLKMIIQYFYWISITLFVGYYYSKIDFISVSKWFLYGALFSIFCFYFVPFNLGLGPIRITLQDTRNSFVFSLICCIPFTFLFVRERYSPRIQLVLILIFLLSILATDGRSGGIIIIIELLWVVYLLFPRFSKAARFLMLIPLIFSFIISASSDELKVVAAETVGAINPRLAKLILQEEESEGDLTFDKSWLHRKLMIDKGMEIFSKHPVFGIGINNFKFYDSDLKTYDDFDRLGNETKDWFNRRSAHNSYLQILTETGVFGFIPLLFIFIIPITFLFKSILGGNGNSLEYLPLVGVLGMSIHFYAISALTGAIPWFILGYSWGLIKSNENF
jgi:O-antigen ligase